MKERKAQKPAVNDAETIQLVTFQVGTARYGIDIGSVTEVVRLLKITPLPKMPAFVEGVVNLRGVIIPIVDLRNRFSLDSITNNARKMRMIITRGAVPPDASSPGLLGLVVDSVEEVIHVPSKDIGPAPQAATGANADFISGMGKVGDRLVILLDMKKILSQQERVALAEAGNA